MSTTVSCDNPGDLNLNDIQDPLPTSLGLPRRNEALLFFNINKVPEFKFALRQFLPKITTTAQVQDTRYQITEFKKRDPAPAPGERVKVTGTNISFTNTGMYKLGVTESLDDYGPFTVGQLSRACMLGDTNVKGSAGSDPDWLPAFKGNIDAVILVAGDCAESVTEGVNAVHLAFDNSIAVVLRVDGQVRPRSEEGHEHFGFLDGISQPTIKQFNNSLPGQMVVDPDVLVLLETGSDRLSKIKNNGSFLVYRHLCQLVPEFNKFLADNPIQDPTLNLNQEQRSELLGARMVGRWKSGAPVQIAQHKDDPILGEDSQRNNDFQFDQRATTMAGCPLFAHVRKSNPRNGLDSETLHKHAIRRSGMPFGPEVSDEEAASGITALNPDGSIPRGLAFMCYQSSIQDGFEFLQEAWANQTDFPSKSTGFDPIIGQARGAPRVIHGVYPSDKMDGSQDHTITLLHEFVVSRGGVYFFVPSLTALKEYLSAGTV